MTRTRYPAGSDNAPAHASYLCQDSAGWGCWQRTGYETPSHAARPAVRQANRETDEADWRGTAGRTFNPAHGWLGQPALRCKA
jgi:hypothetical protein